MASRNSTVSDTRCDDDAAVELLRELVRIPSLSRHEAAAVDWLVEQMRRLGFDSAYRDAAGNAVGWRECRDSAEAIRESGVLLGHIDTVPGAIPVRIEQGKLFGRGSVDAKGSLAAFVIAAARARPSPGQRWIVIGAVEEECSSSAGARFAASQFRPNWCIIGEPSGSNAVTLGYKGRLQVTGAWRQPSQHSAGPRVAVAERVVAWWLQMQEWCQTFNSKRTKLFEQVQIALDDVQTSGDGLADAARARVGLRLPMGFPIDEFTQQFQTPLVDPTDGVEVLIEFSGREIAHQEPRTSPLVQRFNSVFRQLGRVPRHKLKTGTSDMNVVAPVWNCPIVAYGPGDSALDHTPNEHLDLAEYLAAIETLRHVLESPSSDGSPCKRPGYP